MINDPVRAEKWQPVSFVRQQLLTNSFSYLPIFHDGKWKLLSDTQVAYYLRTNPKERTIRLGKKLKDVLDGDDGIKAESTEIVHPEDEISNVLKKFQGKPILVCRKESPQDLIGILTAFDLL